MIFVLLFCLEMEEGTYNKRTAQDAIEVRLYHANSAKTYTKTYWPSKDCRITLDGKDIRLHELPNNVRVNVTYQYKDGTRYVDRIEARTK